MITNTKWRYSDFKHQMQSIDIDDWINALKVFIEYLQKATDFSDIEDNDQIFNIVINCLDNNTHVISEPIKMHHCLQVLLLLSTRISISNIEKFMDKILTRALENKDDTLISNYTLLVTDISSALIATELDRQLTYIKCVFKKCLENLNVASRDSKYITTPLTILTSLLEILGPQVTKQQIINLYRKLNSLIENDNICYINELASLSKIWAIYADPDILHQFIDNLIARVEKESDIAFFVLSTLVISMPITFAPKIGDLANLYFQNIDSLTQESTVSSQALKNAELSINALNALVSTFSDQFASTVDVYSQVAFELFVYRVDSPVFIRSSEIQEVSPDDFDAHEDDDQDLYLNEDVEDEEPYVDESYSIRKAINIFAQTILNHFPDIFLQTFLENEQYQTFTLNFIADPDSGSKSISLQTLLLFIKCCKTKIPELIIKNWIHAFINEISTPTQKDLALLYSAFSEYLLEVPDFIPKYSLKIVQAIQKTQKFSTQTKQQQQTIIPSMFGLFNALITKTINVDEISSLLCQIIEPLIIDNSQSNYQVIFYTCSLLFTRVSSKSIKPLNKLINKIIEFGKSDNLSTIYAIDPLSVYICLFSNLDKDGATTSLKTILGYKSKSVAINKSVLSAITLISSSPSKKILAQVSKDLLSIIQNGISTYSSDAALLYRYLLAFDSCIKGESLFAPKQCDSIVPSLISFLLINDNRVRRITVSVLKNLSSLGSVSTSLTPELKGLFNSSDNITPQIIEGIAEILAPAKDQSLEKVINELIEDGKKLVLKAGFELNCSNIALFVGCLVSNKKALRERILNEFSKDISNGDKSKINPFSIRCIGEIGFRFSLTENKAIVDRIFELVQCDDRLIFSAAIHSAGLISANNTAITTMLPQIIEKMKKDTDHLSKWLNVLAKCLKRRQRIPTDAKFDLSGLLNYLVSQKDYSKETETTYLDCFISILVLNPSLVSIYFEQIGKNNKASPMLSSSIAEYIENSLQTVEQVEPILTKILPYLDPNNPLISTGAISSVRSSIKYKKLLPTFVKKFPTICKCAEVNDKQFIEIFYGATSQKVDIGRQMRANALDTISALFSIIPAKLDANQMIISVTKALNDPVKEIQSKALSFIIKSCDDQKTLKAVLKNLIPTISDINIDHLSLGDLCNDYVQLIAKLKVLTKNSKVLTVEKIAASVPDKKLLQKFEEDFNQEITHNLNHQNKKYNNISAKLICHQLISKYNKEAAEIYVS